MLIVPISVFENQKLRQNLYSFLNQDRIFAVIIDTELEDSCEGMFKTFACFIFSSSRLNCWNSVFSTLSKEQNTAPASSYSTVQYLSVFYHLLTVPRVHSDYAPRTCKQHKKCLSVNRTKIPLNELINAHVHNPPCMSRTPSEFIIFVSSVLALMLML